MSPWYLFWCVHLHCDATEDGRLVTDGSEENCQKRTENHYADDGVTSTMNAFDREDAVLGRITFADFDLYDK